MAGDHAAKKGSPKKGKGVGMPRSAGKKVKTLPVEELSPERRTDRARGRSKAVSRKIAFD